MTLLQSYPIIIPYDSGGGDISIQDQHMLWGVFIFLNILCFSSILCMSIIDYRKTNNKPRGVIGLFEGLIDAICEITVPVIGVLWILIILYYVGAFISSLIF